jgi:tetratricopeptide (TPR) repeat protein
LAKNDSLKEKYYAYYFKKLKRLNMEHEFSGVKHMPLNEFYDMDIENIKCLLTYMEEDEMNNIEFYNSSRFLLQDRIHPEQRGMMYHRLKKYVEDLENPMEKSLYYEGFSLIYFQLTDYNSCYVNAKKSLEIKEDIYVLSEKAQDEIELLSPLKIIGDVFFTQELFEKSKPIYERMVDISTKCCMDWQRQVVSSNPQELEEKEDYILDSYLSHAQIKLSLINLSLKGDFKNSKKIFDRGINTLKKINGAVHPV